MKAKMLRILSEAYAIGKRYNEGDLNARYELKGLRRGIEILGYGLNASETYGQIHSIEVYKGSEVEGIYLDIKIPEESA